MFHRSFSAAAVFVLALSLAACGGGTNTIVVQPTNPPTNGSITIAPSSLNFTGPGTAPQSFTVTSSLGALPLPAIDLQGCGPVATLATSSTALPATYTVTPTGNGACSIVFAVNHNAVALGIAVGGGTAPTLGATGPVTVFVGGTAGSVTVTASSGNIIADASSCSGIAAVNGSGGASPQTFSIAAVSAGTCTLVISDGASSTLVSITVNPNPAGPNALTLTPSTLTFSSPNAGSQQTTLNFTGNVGTVSFNEDDCIGNTGRPKIAFFTLTGVPPGTPISLPQNLTVQPYGTAGTDGLSCSIIFTSSVGASQAVLTVFIQ